MSRWIRRLTFPTLLTLTNVCFAGSIFLAAPEFVLAGVYFEIDPLAPSVYALVLLSLALTAYLVSWFRPIPLALHSAALVIHCTQFLIYSVLSPSVEYLPSVFLYLTLVILVGKINSIHQKYKRLDRYINDVGGN
jgi:hypothetical protein